jgi:long-subunit acyl-CoA synthetase (AMP-forming)
VGGVPVPVYQDSVTEELAYVVEHAGARYAVAENQEQIDKLVEIQKRVPTLKTLIYDDVRGLRHYEGLLSYDEVQALGDKRLAASAGLVADAVARGRGDRRCIMLYTSGTTGRPKGGGAELRQPDLGGARGRRVRRAEGGRRAPVLPADGLGRRSPVLVCRRAMCWAWW